MPLRSAHARAPAVCAVCSCGLSSAGACSGPCLLRVPVLCVLGPCTFVLVVWCACVALVYKVRPSPVNVVDITGVRRPVLCAGAVHDCVVRACASHDRVACTCCACACSACLRCARLRFPCSRCVHLLCSCTCLYCSNIVCFSLVLLYLLVLSCTCMPMLISDIPSSIHWEYSLYTSVGSLWDLEAE